MLSCQFCESFYISFNRTPTGNCPCNGYAVWIKCGTKVANKDLLLSQLFLLKTDRYRRQNDFFILNTCSLKYLSSSRKISTTMFVIKSKNFHWSNKGARKMFFKAKGQMPVGN